jgi:sec-independent protein translocase protein TatA
MFGISGEHLLILGIVLLIFGPRRLPELGNTLGKAIRNFKDSVSGVEEAAFRKIPGEEEKKNQAGNPTQTAQDTTPPKDPNQSGQG